MRKTREDLTISEALRDPLIAMVLRADGVKLEDFKQLLETAAHKREPRPSTVRPATSASPCTTRR